MPDNLIEFSPSAYQYPLLIKHLLHYPLSPLAGAGDRVPRPEAAHLPDVP